MGDFFSKLLGRGQRPPTAPSAPRRPAPSEEASPVPDSPDTSPRAEAAGGPDLAEFMTVDHRRCDALWADVEEHGAEAFPAFDAAMRHHLAMEEDTIFPAFEAATGMGGMGPTEVMRSEHEQMRRVLDAMAVAEGDELLDLGDTLLMLIQQHNVKEEGMLYPMAQEMLHGQWPDLRARLQER